jgi:hypothetical protein
VPGSAALPFAALLALDDGAAGTAPPADGKSLPAEHADKIDGQADGAIAEEGTLPLVVPTPLALLVLPPPLPSPTPPPQASPAESGGRAATPAIALAQRPRTQPPLTQSGAPAAAGAEVSLPPDSPSTFDRAIASPPASDARMLTFKRQPDPQPQPVAPQPTAALPAHAVQGQLAALGDAAASLRTPARAAACKPDASAPPRTSLASKGDADTPPRAELAADLPPIMTLREPSAQHARAETVVPPGTQQQQSPQDFGALVDRLVAAREASHHGAVSASLLHDDFGRVDLRFAPDAGGLSVGLRSLDPQFTPAVQAAAQTADAGSHAGRGDGSSSGGAPQQSAQQSGQNPAHERSRAAIANASAATPRPAARTAGPASPGQTDRRGIYA